MNRELIPLPVYSGGLWWARLPGPHGPILRCYGTLDAGTGERFRKETMLLTSLGHRAVVLNLSHLRLTGEAGLLMLLECVRGFRRAGVRTVVVTRSPGLRETLLQPANRGHVLVARSEEDASQMLSFLLGELEPADQSWREAQESSARYWSELLQLAEDAPASEIAFRLTSMHALCDKSEQTLREREGGGISRCEYCPLFHSLGGRERDLGCDSVVDPILGALARGDVREARHGIARVTAAIEALP